MKEKNFNNTNFKKLRQFFGFTQAAFATKLGTSQQTIAMIENNKRNVPSSIREGFYKAFNLSYEDAVRCETLEELNTALKTPLANTNAVLIPFYSVHASAGSGETLLDKPEKDMMYFDKRFLKTILKTENYTSLHVIYAQGDSMDSGWNQPDDIKDGDLLMVDTSQVTGNNKIFVILVNNNELRVKRLFKKGEALYISSNNAKYKEEVYYPDTTDFEIRIIGRVVWNGSKENV